MKKNVRARQRKYKSRKKYVIPMIVLSVLLVISVMGVYAATTPDFDDATGLQYKILTEDTSNKTGTVSIVGYAGADSTLKIPASVKHGNATDGGAEYTYTITKIGNSTNALGNTTGAFEGKTTLTSVSFENGNAITTIDERAFKGCTALQSIDFTNSQYLTTIGEWAFDGCTNLKTLNFDNCAKLTTIDKRAFLNCKSLTSVDLSDATSLQKLPHSTFRDCYNLKTVSFPPSLNRIGNDAFYGCASLTEIKTLPTNTEIEIGAFNGCCYLTPNVFNNMNQAPDPFGKSNIIPQVNCNVRGTAVTKIVAADGTPPNGVDFPLQYFTGQKYNISLRTPDGYELSGLELRPDANIPDKYTIDPDTFTPAGTADDGDSHIDTYTFEIPAKQGNKPLYIFAAATAKTPAGSGAPTIITDSLPNCIAGQAYPETKLEANSETPVTWKIVSGSLPDGLTLDKDTGIISGKPTASAGQKFRFTVRATNQFSFHEKSFEIGIYTSSFEKPTGLHWVENVHDDTIYAAWEPLKASEGNLPYTGNITYIVELFDENGTKIAEKEQTVGSSEALQSKFTLVNFTQEIKDAGIGEYTFTVNATSDNYGSSGRSEMSKPLEYGYVYHTITATSDANGTIALSQASSEIKGVTFTESDDKKTITVKVRDGVISENNPLTFTITPNKDYQVDSITLDGAKVAAYDAYSFQSVTEDHILKASFDLVSNRIDGINANAYYVKGDSAAFQAIGDGMDIQTASNGDIRWRPDRWNLRGTNTAQLWTKAPYEDSVDTSKLEPGDYTLEVTFQQEQYSAGEGWKATGQEDTRTVTFHVVASASEIPDDPSGGNNNGGDNNGSTGGTTGGSSSGGGSASGSSGGGGGLTDTITSYLSNPRTGDNVKVGIWGAIALISLAGIGFCTFRMFKFS